MIEWIPQHHKSTFGSMHIERFVPKQSIYNSSHSHIVLLPPPLLPSPANSQFIWQQCESGANAALSSDTQAAKMRALENNNNSKSRYHRYHCRWFYATLILSLIHHWVDTCFFLYYIQPCFCRCTFTPFLNNLLGETGNKMRKKKKQTDKGIYALHTNRCHIVYAKRNW